ncbi:adenylosuccinate synthetase, partial [mine drainage metagenome]
SEFGTTTGRPRRVGWFDIPALRYSLLLNDVDFIALTKLDTLGMLDRIGIGYAYTLNDEPLAHFPKDFRTLEKVTVEYREAQPWGKLGDEILEEVRKKGMAGFPRELREYIGLVEKLSGFPVKIISFGSRREMTFDRSELSPRNMDQVI